MDRVLGFEMGCDDYIAKPFMPQELIFRVKNALIATQRNVPKRQVLVYDEYTIDLDKHVVLQGDKLVPLTSKEYDLLAYFLSVPGEALSRERIIRDAWGGDTSDAQRGVDNFVKRLRAKLPFLRIETVYGAGYRYVR